jgi:N-acetylglucosamine-6-sulfatase
MAQIDKDFRKRAQSVLAVDAMIGELQAAVGAIGLASNTYFVFSSDNGYHMGEHSLMPGKMTAFDMDIHVPLIITGPSVPAGTSVEEIVENVDLCPTFTELGGMMNATSIHRRTRVYRAIAPAPDPPARFQFMASR